MLKTGKNWSALWIGFVLVALVALTSNWIDIYADLEFIKTASSDMLNYFKIAESAPSLPDYIHYSHHAQRFLLPYLTGLFAKLFGLDIQTGFRLVTFAVAVATGYTVARFSLAATGNSAVSFLLTAFVVFNPYAVRIFFSYSAQTIDPAFTLFLVAASAFAFFHRWMSVAVCLLLAGFFRQTVLIVLPVFALWMLFDFYVRPAGRTLSNRLALIVLLLAPPLVFWLTGFVAATFSDTNINGELMTGLLIWMRNNFSASELAVFLLRGALPFLPLTAFLLGAVLKKREIFIRLPMEANFLLLIGAAVCAQPLLGGPIITMGAFPRLTCLALPVLALYGAQVLKNIQIAETGWAWFGTAIAAIAMSSMHHIFSYNGSLTSDKSGAFAILTIGASIVLLICGWQMMANATVESETV